MCFISDTLLGIRSIACWLIYTSSDSTEDLRPLKMVLAGALVICPRVYLFGVIEAGAAAERLLWAKLSVHLIESVHWSASVCTESNYRDEKMRAQGVEVTPPGPNSKENCMAKTQTQISEILKHLSPALRLGRWAFSFFLPPLHLRYLIFSLLALTVKHFLLPFIRRENLF